MTIKKLLASILCVTMLLSTMATGVFADETTVIDLSTAAEGVITLATGTYTLPRLEGQTVIIKAAEGADVTIDVASPVRGGTDVTFENVTFDYYPNTTYTGIQHAGNLTYNNCTINGQVFLYGTSETFNNCTFNQNSADAYNVWTYGAKNVAFNGCTFNCEGKSVLVYNEGATGTVLEVTDTDFIANNPVEDKAAVEIDGSLLAGNDVHRIVIDDASTDSGFAAGNVSGSTLWNNKTNDGAAEVTVAGEKVLEISKIPGSGTAEEPYVISSIGQLKKFRDNVNSGTTYSREYVKLAADIDLNNEEWTPIGNSANKFQGTFDGAGHTISNLFITGNNSDVGLFGFTTNGEVKNLTVNNAKVSGRLNVGVVAGTPYTSKYTGINVTGHVEVNGMAYVGGVGGKNAYANWTDITVAVDDTSYVKANSVENGTAYRTYVGGVIGFMGEGGHAVKNVASNIDVIGSTCDVGGIAGIAHYGNRFINCSSSGDVYLEDANESEVGGIAGVWHNQTGKTVTFENCSFTGTIYIGGNPVNVAISGPAYSETGTGERTITGKVTLNGVEKESLATAIAEAKEMTEPAEIDLLGNNATIDKAYALRNDITFKNGMIIFDGFNGLDPDTYDPAGIYHAVMTIGANVTFDDVILTGKNATAKQGIFVLGANGVMSLTNSSELNVTAPTATAVIYGEGAGKLVVNGSKLHIDGENKPVRGMLAVELDADNAEITITDITDNAMRNVKGAIDNSQITIDGAEYGIKNKDYNETLAVTNSSITITNTANETENAGIYLVTREDLADTNSIIHATIYVEGGSIYNTLTFETNGGSMIASVTDQDAGAVVDLSGYTPAKAGHTFAGWYSDAALTQRISSVTLDEAKTVYAKWVSSAPVSGGSSGSARRSITFEANGGTAISKVTKVKNTTVDLSAFIPEREGYRFDGWYTDKELSNKITSIKLTKDVTVYAKWVEIIDEADGWKSPFADVNAGDWYFGHVQYVVENNLMSGMSETTFAPDDNLTRAMLVTVFYRLEGEPATNGSIPFADVDVDSYYADAVSWAKENGIVNGVSETEFAPDVNITREQIAAMLYRYAQYKGYDVSAYENTDILSYEDAASVSDYAVAAMQYVVGSGLIQGRSATTLNPKDHATRAEFAAILQRFIEANSN